MRNISYLMLSAAIMAAGTAHAAPECYRNHSYDRAMAVASDQLAKCQLSAAERAYDLMSSRYPDDPTPAAIAFASTRCGDEYAVFRAVVAGCFSNHDARAESLADDFHKVLFKEVEKIVRASAAARKR